MPVDEEYDSNVKDLITIAGEYMQWFFDVVKVLHYPAAQTERTLPEKTKIFSDWVFKARETEFPGAQMLERLQTLDNELTTLIQNYADEAFESGQAITLKQFEKLSTTYEAFAENIRRLQLDSIYGDAGIDLLTGLRSEKAMDRDFVRELERLARQGAPSSVALLKIDVLELVHEKLGKDAAQECTQRVANVIKKFLRSFDDGYRLSNNEIVLSIKQADSAGAIKALERLQAMLKEQDMKYEIDGTEVPVTVSSFAVQLLPSDNVFDLLENLRTDMYGGGDRVGTILEYHEISPLERYVQQVQKEGQGA